MSSLLFCIVNFIQNTLSALCSIESDEEPRDALEELR
jgi:hypothetical protein